MSDEVEIVNLFGKLALDQTLQITTSKVEEQTAIIEAVRVLLTAINNKAVTLNTADIKGEVSISNLPADPPTETTLTAIKNLNSDLKTLTSAIKDLVIVTNSTLGAMNTKIVNQDTKAIEGSVVVSNTPEVIVDFPSVQAVTVTNQVDPLTNEELRATPLEVNIVASTGGGLTDEQLRTNPVPVILDSVPLATGAASEVSLSSLLTKTNSILVQLQNTLVKADTDNVAVTAGDLRILTAMRSIGRMSYDGSNNLRVVITPSGSQTVTWTGSPTVGITSGASIGLGNINSQGTGVVLSRLSFYKMLERISF